MKLPLTFEEMRLPTKPKSLPLGVFKHQAQKMVQDRESKSREAAPQLAHLPGDREGKKYHPSPSRAVHSPHSHFSREQGYLQSCPKTGPGSLFIF